MLTKVLFVFAAFIKVQNAIINQIQFHTFWRGLIIDVFFCLQADGRITGVRVGVGVGVGVVRGL